MCLNRLLPLAILCALALPLQAREYVDIQKRLTAEQMQATGLDQLSSDQLQLLNSLLDEDRKAVVEEVRKERRDEGPRVTGTLFGSSGLDPVNSELTGDLRGWSRGTILTLENGQRWRVIDGDYYAGKSLSGAKVTVSPGKISGWYLQVEGHNPRPKVQRAD